MENKLKATARVLEVMDTLREQCPWDREQTFASLRNNTIEEAFELTDAITDGNMDGIKEELGDVLFAAVCAAFMTDMDPEEALHGTCEKFIKRFAAMEQSATAQGRGLDAYTPAEQLSLWEDAKAAEYWE